MEGKSRTALVSAFSRAYHSENNEVKVFNDGLAKRLLSEAEYNQIAQGMSSGIGFFNLDFVGTAEEALRWIVDNQLSPAPLARAAFAEEALEHAVLMGTKQYLIFAAGYDTFAYRQPEWAKQLHIIEIDSPDTASDKQIRLRNAGIEIPDNVCYIAANFLDKGWERFFADSTCFDSSKTSFCSLLGLTYYLSKQGFKDLISLIDRLIPKDSCLAFDYPDQNTVGLQAKKQMQLAAGANEMMLAEYSENEIRHLLSGFGYEILEHLSPKEVTTRYFYNYNSANPEYSMRAFENVNLCLAIKK